MILAVYTCIAVGSDGSTTSQQAITRAAELAASLGASLKVVVVYEPGHGSELAPIIARGGRSKELLEACRPYTTARGDEPDFHLLSGDAAEQMVSLANEVDADLVVVGSKGMGGLKDSLKGSVPTRIARGAGCDVLVVRTD